MFSRVLIGDEFFVYMKLVEVVIVCGCVDVVIFKLERFVVMYFYCELLWK